MARAQELNELIVEYVQVGYRFIFRGADSVQLIRPRTFYFWLGVIALPVALLYYLVQPEDQVFIYLEGSEYSIIEQVWEPPWYVGLVVWLLVLAEFIVIIGLLGALYGD